MTKVETAKVHKISWLGAGGKTINPLRVKGGGHHCTKCSPGCTHCYAEGINNRFGNGIPYDNRPVEFDLDLSVFDRLPKHKSVRVFVQSMGDLFHEQVPNWMIYEVLRMVETLPHRFLILTKQPERMHSYFYTSWSAYTRKNNIPNLALGVTVCNQAEADEKIPLLLQTPAAMRFVSLEPLLGGVNLTDHEWWDWRYTYDFYPKGMFKKPLDLVITGGESGPGARPSHPDWFRSVRDQCAEAGVPYFHKQNGEFEAVKIPGICCNLGTLKPNQSVAYGDGKTFYYCYNRVGRKRAGHLLDGVEHHAFPEGW